MLGVFEECVADLLSHDGYSVIKIFLTACRLVGFTVDISTKSRIWDYASDSNHNIMINLSNNIEVDLKNLRHNHEQGLLTTLGYVYEVTKALGLTEPYSVDRGWLATQTGLSRKAVANHLRSLRDKGLI